MTLISVSQNGPVPMTSLNSIPLQVVYLCSILYLCIDRAFSSSVWSRADQNNWPKIAWARWSWTASRWTTVWCAENEANMIWTLGNAFIGRSELVIWAAWCKQERVPILHPLGTVLSPVVHYEQCETNPKVKVSIIIMSIIPSKLMVAMKVT